VFRAGFKAMVLGIIIALGSVHVLTKFTLVESPTTLPTLDMLAGLALGVLVILMLALHAPKYASAVISGSPSNNAGALVGAAGGIAAAGAMGVRGAAAGVRGAWNAGESVARTLHKDFGGGSAGAASAASSLGGSGGGPGGASPGAPRAPSGGGSPRPASPGNAVFIASGPGGPAGGGSAAAAAAETAIGEAAAAEAISDGAAPPPSPPSTSAPSAPTDPSSPAAASGASSMPWYAAAGGASLLSSPQLAAARRAYDAWSLGNPELANRYGFASYVNYAQERHAESVTDTDQQDEA
jgi:hypothetical protein